MNLEWSGLVDLEEQPTSQEVEVQYTTRAVEEELAIQTMDDELAPPQTGQEEPLRWVMLD